MDQTFDIVPDFDDRFQVVGCGLLSSVAGKTGI
jgi:hypothetical protein